MAIDCVYHFTTISSSQRVEARLESFDRFICQEQCLLLSAGELVAERADGDEAESIATGILTQLGKELNNARGVDFGEFFKVRAYLDGTVEGLLGHLTADNSLNTKFIAGKELKLSRDTFSFRNVLETGDLPYIDNVQGVYAGEGLVRVGEPVQLVGSQLKLGSDDKIEIYKVEDDGTLVLTGTTRSSGLSQNTDLVVAFAAGSAFDGLPEGQKVAFKVVKSVTIEGATETVTSNVAKATLLNP